MRRSYTRRAARPPDRRSPTPRLRSLLVAIIVALSISGAGAPVGAGELDDYLTAGDVLPGKCLPETVLYGQVVDCRFPLSRPGELDPRFGPHVADQDVVFDDENDDQADCVVEGMELVCRGLNVYYGLGGSTVRALVSGVLSEATASFEAADWVDHGLNLTALNGGEPYVFEGGSLGAWLDTTVAAEQVFARITTRDGSDEVATVPIGRVRPNAFERVDINLTGIAPGRYRVTPCLGDLAEGCDPIPGGQVFQVGHLELLEVIPGWNRAEADRINIVFTATGFESVDDALDMAQRLLTWDGPTPLGFDGFPLEGDLSPELVALIEFGPFAIEPLASHRDRFNLWMLDDLVADARAMVHSAPPYGFGPPVPAFGLDDVSVTALHLNSIGRFGRSEAGWTSFTSPEGPSTVEREGLEFAGVYLALPRDWPIGEADTLAHEWGHALFDLRDEYVEEGRSVTHGYPNCAPDQATAEAWWGGLVGEIDPFVYQYVAALERYSVWIDPFLTDRVAIGYEVGGCYSDGSDAVRPTGDSLMNSGIPVFGSVNRRRGEEILALWSGRLVLSDISEVSVDCDPVDPGRPAAVCRATLVPMVGAPPGGLVLTLEDGTRSTCAVESGGGEEPTVMACRMLPLTGTGPWAVTIGTASGSVVVATAIAGPPPTTTTTSTTAPLPEPPTPPVPVWPLAAAGLALLALVVVTAVRRTRR